MIPKKNCHNNSSHIILCFCSSEMFKSSSKCPLVWIWHLFMQPFFLLIQLVFILPNQPWLGLNTILKIRRRTIKYKDSKSSYWIRTWQTWTKRHARMKKKKCCESVRAAVSPCLICFIRSLFACFVSMWLFDLYVLYDSITLHTLTVVWPSSWFDY
jgi:hypothetical protein